MMVAGPIPTIQELEAAEALDDDAAESGFGEQDATAGVMQCDSHLALLTMHQSNALLVTKHNTTLSLMCNNRTSNIIRNACPAL